MSTLRIVPVVDGIGEAGTGSSDFCTCISVNGPNIFAGQNSGIIERYQVISSNQPVSVPTVTLVSKIDTGSKRPIISIHSVGSCVLALSGDALYFVPCSFERGPAVFMKGVLAFALREESLDQAEYPSIVISTSKKRLVVYHFDGKAYVPDEVEINTGSENVVRLVWLNSWVVGATSRAYVAVSPFSDDKNLREVLPVDNAPTIGVIRQSNELVLTGHEGLGIFLNIHASPSDFPTPAPRSTVPLDSHEPLAITTLGNYMVAITPSDGSVNVFTLVNANDTKLVQSINLPGSCVAGLCSNQESIGVVSGSVMYLLIPVPFEVQFKKLIDQKKFPEALEVINYQYPTDSDKKQLAITNFHKELAWSLFNDKNFPVAFVHFSLCFARSNADEIELRKLLNFFKNDCHTLRELIGNDLDQLNTAITTALPFFQSQRNVLASSPPLQDTRKSILCDLDGVMIQMMSKIGGMHDELIAFLSQENLYLTDSKFIREIVGESDPFVLALISRKEGDVRGALDLLLKNSNFSNSKYIVDILAKSSDTLSDSEKLSYLSKLIVSSDIDIGTILKLVSSLPTDSREKFFDSLEKSAKERLYPILEQLSSEDEVARRRFVGHLIHTNKIEQLERLIVQYGSQLADFLPKDNSFTFCRMLILGAQGKHKEALAIDPNRGEEYIEHQGKTIRSVDLFLILISVLFERGDSLRALSIIEREMKLFTESNCVSRLVEIVPPELMVDEKLVVLLKKIHTHLTLKKRSTIVEENLGSYAFLNTYSEWSGNRQTNPVVVREDCLCAVCNQSITDQFHRLSAIAVLPNSSIAHPTCIDGGVQRKNRLA